MKKVSFLKIDPGTDVFHWILRNFSEHLFLQNTSGRLLLNITLTRVPASRLIRSFIKKFHLNSFVLSQIFSAPDSHRDLTHFYGPVFSVISLQTAVRRIKVLVKITFLAKYDQSIWKLHAISCFGSSSQVSRETILKYQATNWLFWAVASIWKIIIAAFLLLLEWPCVSLT